MLYDYKKDRKIVDAMVMPYLPGLYEQCLPIFSKLLEHYWLENPEITTNKVKLYREFSNSNFADHVYKNYFYEAFVVGWKLGYFPLVQIINYNDILEKDLENVGSEMVEEAEKYYSIKIALQMLILLETARDIGMKSGQQTNTEGNK